MSHEGRPDIEHSERPYGDGDDEAQVEGDGDAYQQQTRDEAITWSMRDMFFEKRITYSPLEFAAALSAQRLW